MTLEEQIAHYAAVRRRLGYNHVVRTAVTVVQPEPEIKPASEPVVAPPLTKKARIYKLMRHICAQREITLDEVLSTCRKQKIVRARWEVMLQAHYAGWSTLQIGRIFDQDHTSVLNGLNRIKQMLADGSYELCVLPPDLAFAAPQGNKPRGGTGHRENVSRPAGDTRCANHV